MIKKNERESIGSLKISQEVITSIANVAACEVEGVASIVDNGKIKDMFNIKRGFAAKSMKIDAENDLAVIDVYINVKHGSKIQIISQNVQKKVKDAIQSMTGIAISKVNVHIVGINFENENVEDDSDVCHEDVEDNYIDD